MNVSRYGAIVVALAGIGVLVTGCRERGEEAYGTERERRNEQVAPAVPPATPPAQPQYGEQQQLPIVSAPAGQIAQARCETMQRCGKIKAGEKYASMESCLSEVRREWAEELNAYECPGGFVAKELNECLSEVRTEDCNNPIDRLGSFAACRSSDICKAMP